MILDACQEAWSGFCAALQVLGRGSIRCSHQALLNVVQVHRVWGSRQMGTYQPGLLPQLQGGSGDLPVHCWLQLQEPPGRQLS